MAERIVSPGVFTREKDLSFLPHSIGAIGAGPAIGNGCTAGRDLYRTVAQAFNAKIPKIIINVTVKSFLLVEASKILWIKASGF